MIQQITIRQQILAALQRVYDGMAFNEPLSADRIEKSLLAEFSPTAYALTPNPNLDFDRLARANGYVRVGQDENPPVFDHEEARYLMEAIEHMKCDDCTGRCNISPCIYLTLKSKFEAILEVNHD